MKALKPLFTSMLVAWYAWKRIFFLRFRCKKKMVHVDLCGDHVCKYTWKAHLAPQEMTIKSPFHARNENAKDGQNESQTKVFDPLSAVRVIHENTKYFFRQPPPKISLTVNEMCQSFNVRTAYKIYYCVVKKRWNDYELRYSRIQEWFVVLPGKPCMSIVMFLLILWTNSNLLSCVHKKHLYLLFDCYF